MTKFTTGRGKLLLERRFPLETRRLHCGLSGAYGAVSPSRCDCVYSWGGGCYGRGQWTCTHGTEACQQQLAAVAVPLDLTGGA